MRKLSDKHNELLERSGLYLVGKDKGSFNSFDIISQLIECSADPTN